MKTYKYCYQFPYTDYKNYSETIDEACSWCIQSFGPEYERWACFMDGFKFRNKKDYNWFLLRWT